MEYLDLSPLDPKIEKVAAIVEAILLVSEDPVSTSSLVTLLQDSLSPTAEEVDKSLDCLKQRYQSTSCGLELRVAGGGVRLATKAGVLEWVQKYLAVKPMRLSKAALETLSLVAYRQPITRAEINQARGVESAHLIRSLMERGLVKMGGKTDLPGRPVQYQTTEKFLEVVGLSDLSKLPPLSELEKLGMAPTPSAPPFDENLDRFMENRDMSVLGEEVAEGSTSFQELSDAIDSVPDDDKEIYLSPLHFEIAKQNQLSTVIPENLSFNFPSHSRSNSLSPSLSSSEVFEEGSQPLTN